LHLEFQVEVVTLPDAATDAGLRSAAPTVWLSGGRHFFEAHHKEAAYVEQFTDSNTVHRYRVIRLGTRPLPPPPPQMHCPAASLAASESPVELLNRVALEVGKIEKSRPDGRLPIVLRFWRAYGLTSHNSPSIQRGDYVGI